MQIVRKYTILFFVSLFFLPVVAWAGPGPVGVQELEDNVFPPLYVPEVDDPELLDENPPVVSHSVEYCKVAWENEMSESASELNIMMVQCRQIYDYCWWACLGGTQGCHYRCKIDALNCVSGNLRVARHQVCSANLHRFQCLAAPEKYDSSAINTFLINCNRRLQQNSGGEFPELSNHYWRNQLGL